jgi:hypothetical protein
MKKRTEKLGERAKLFDALGLLMGRKKSWRGVWVY